MLAEYLDNKGLGSNTQALVFYAVAKKGEKPIDGKTDVNPEVCHLMSFYVVLYQTEVHKSPILVFVFTAELIFSYLL